MASIPIVNFTVKRGAPFTRSVAFSAGLPVPAAVILSGVVFALEVKAAYASIAPFFTLTEAVNGGIVVDALNGQFVFTMSASQLSLIIGTEAIYSLKLTYANGTPEYLFQGKMVMQP